MRFAHIASAAIVMFALPSVADTKKCLGIDCGHAHSAYLAFMMTKSCPSVFRIIPNEQKQFDKTVAAIRAFLKAQGEPDDQFFVDQPLGPSKDCEDGARSVLTQKEKWRRLRFLEVQPAVKARLQSAL